MMKTRILIATGLAVCCLCLFRHHYSSNISEPKQPVNENHWDATNAIRQEVETSEPTVHLQFNELREAINSREQSNLQLAVEVARQLIRDDPSLLTNSAALSESAWQWWTNHVPKL